MKSSTLFAASVRWRPQAGGNMLVQSPRIDLLPDGSAGPRHFKIKTAEAESRRGLVDNLLKARYGWRGYKQVALPTDQSVHRFTLVAIENDSTIGTITVSMDGEHGLSVDEAFAPEVAELRAQGRRICEFTKLAVDPTVGTKRVLATLFHVAYIVAHRIRGYDTLLIEVNPRHVRFYERMLGFNVLCEPRLNRNVNAPAVLLMVEFSYVMQQIGNLAGQPERLATERSLYPGFMSLTEEAGVKSRMEAKQLALQQQRQQRPEAPQQTLPPLPTEFQASDLMS